MVLVKVVHHLLLVVVPLLALLLRLLPMQRNFNTLYYS